MDKPKTINRRKNWQLYDAAQKKRVTFNQIRKMVVAGTDVRFIDEHSGDDITVATLLHIISDKEQAIQRSLKDVLIA